MEPEAEAGAADYQVGGEDPCDHPHEYFDRDRDAELRNWLKPTKALRARKLKSNTKADARR